MPGADGGALGVVAGVNLLVGLAVALTMLAFGEPAAGSFAFGASLAGVGLFFTGVAAVAMQVSQTTSSAYGITGAVVGAAYALGPGDVGNGTLSWLSPIGWGQAMRPYADERWWPLLLLIGGATAGSGCSLALLDRRDDGAGLFPTRARPTPARGSPGRSASR